MGQYEPAFHRTIMIVDVEHFSDPSRTNLDQLAVRDGLYKALIQALGGSGPTSSVSTEPDDLKH
jgi:hypothetical protein